MDVKETMKNRRSIRKYDDGAVSEEQLFQILEAAQCAPSWKNMQCWYYIVVSDKDLKRKLGRAVNFNPDRTSYEKAAYVLVLCADPEKSGDRENKPYYLVDAAISFQQAILAATDLGLGTCWVGLFDEQPVKALLDIPENIRIVALTPVGNSAQTRDAKSRRPLDEFVFSNTWQTPLTD